MHYPRGSTPPQGDRVAQPCKTAKQRRKEVRGLCTFAHRQLKLSMTQDTQHIYDAYSFSGERIPSTTKKKLFLGYLDGYLAKSRRNKPFKVLLRSNATGEAVGSIEKGIAILLHVCCSLEIPEGLCLLGAGNVRRDAVGRLCTPCLMLILVHKIGRNMPGNASLISLHLLPFAMKHISHAEVVHSRVFQINPIYGRLAEVYVIYNSRNFEEVRAH